MLNRQDALRNEAALWALCLSISFILGSLLIIQSANKGRLQSSPVADGVLGRAYLDLNKLAQAYSVDDADNVRWSLVRRTPAAAQIYNREAGVDWETLRHLAETGTILLPAGFSWSFNETFQRGPGYKEAEGVLAGGHCALATTFRAAAIQAGLPTEARPHAGPIPGFPLEETVNIWWGRDDLVVRNTTHQDLYFIWEVTTDEVAVAVAPVTAHNPLPPLPDLHSATVTMVYGRPGPGGWGSLGQTNTADHALYLARTYAQRVDAWNGGRTVVTAVNPNIALRGKLTGRELYLYYLIAEARRQGYYVMLDVHTGEQAPLPLFEIIMDRFLQDNVWIDWDIEHTAGGKVDAEQINQVAAAYFAHRKARGYQSPGVFGFYVFKESQVTNPVNVRRQYDSGVVVPIFDGFGGHEPDPARDKIVKTARVLSLFGDGPFGIMEFETRWGTRYDRISAQSYFGFFPDALIMASQ